jgi:hypothetical protein
MRHSALPCWARLCAAALGVFATGCDTGHLHAQVLQQPCAPLPCGADHVYVYMVNGLTILPHVFGSMNGVGPHVEEDGFRKPRVASHYWRKAFLKEIRRVRCEDPQARFVLVGYSIGGSVVYGMAQDLQADGIFIDLMIYIDAHSFIHDLGCHPQNVGKVVSINSSSLFLPGKCHPGEECYHVDTPRHLAIPHKDETLAIMTEALRQVRAAACAPPVPEGVPQVVPVPSGGN